MCRGPGQRTPVGADAPGRLLLPLWGNSPSATSARLLPTAPRLLSRSASAGPVPLPRYLLETVDWSCLRRAPFHRRKGAKSRRGFGPGPPWGCTEAARTDALPDGPRLIPPKLGSVCAVPAWARPPRAAVRRNRCGSGRVPVGADAPGRLLLPLWGNSPSAHIGPPAPGRSALLRRGGPCGRPGGGSLGRGGKRRAGVVTRPYVPTFLSRVRRTKKAARMGRLWETTQNLMRSAI